MKKYILAISLLISSSTSFASNALIINGTYADDFDTNNTVFNIVYKSFIKNYEKDFIVLKKSIENNNNSKDKPIKFVYDKVDDAFKKFEFKGRRTLDQELNTYLSQYEYDLKKVLKSKSDYQEKEVDTFLNNQLIKYRNILKNTLNDYKLNNEEKLFISEKSKKIALIIKTEIDSNNGYSKRKIDALSKNLSNYSYINKEYSFDLDNMNNKIDKAIFKELWPSIKSNSKYPDQE